MSRLFRSAAIEASAAKRGDQLAGSILLVRPVSFTAMTLFALAIAAALVTFLFLGTYTKRSTVAGQLVPDLGLVKIYVPQSGIVLESHVSEGQIVNAGDILYVLSSERQSSTQEGIQASINRQVKIRQQSFLDERNKTKLLQSEETDALTKKISALQIELLKIDGQIENQSSRVRLSEETIKRYQGLQERGYISAAQMQQKVEDLLDQRSRLQGLERDRIVAQRELEAQQNELDRLSLKHRNQLAQIERSITSTEQELTESEAKRRLVITAPKSGVATAVTAQIGQTVTPSTPLVSLVPVGAKLQAHLFASSRMVGFIKPSDTVQLRYQAYPYQKFGQHKGTVVDVAKTALPSSEIAVLGGATANGEPLYRITVNLAKQEIIAYGKPQPLQVGMLLEADVLQDTRRLYEWVLDPLYSLTGKL